MNFSAKKVLCVDLLNKTSEVRSFPDLNEYLGGVGLGLKLFEMHAKDDPLVFSIGPLNGFFPFVSKTSVVLSMDGAVEDIYIGGSLSFRFAYSGVDSIVILGKSKEIVTLDILNELVDFKHGDIPSYSLGLPGKKSVISVEENEAILDNYFSTADNILGKKFVDKNIKSIVLTGSLIFDIPNIDKYSLLYKDILEKNMEVSVNMGSYPSCSGCPVGCDKSHVGEMGGNILGHCLVSCEYAKKIYSDVGIVFSCLNVLGYDYTHEDLEKIPPLVENLLKNI